MAVFRRRTRIASFRLSDDEYEHLRRVSLAEGAPEAARALLRNICYLVREDRPEMTTAEIRDALEQLARAGTLLGPAEARRIRELGEDPDRLSFLHCVRVVQRRMARFVAIPPSAEESFS
jgi:Cdc6-like AAA superfamily ATPase